ncbi:MAG: dihydrofolate reductase [Pseudomonadota bacterium]
MIRIAMMVAAAENGVIGSGNGLPWHLPEDLRHFKRVTMGKPILMGRKTFQSIGRPLPGRTNIVISRDPTFHVEGVTVLESLDLALREATLVAEREGANEMVVIGGAEIYQAALPQVERLYMTEVHAPVEGDVMLPLITWSHWRETQRERHAATAGNPFDYSFVVYERLTES